MQMPSIRQSAAHVQFEDDDAGHGRSILHHDAILNEAQKQEIITWINSINENNSLSEN